MKPNDQDGDDAPEPLWDELHTVPRCAESDCRHFDGKRCQLIGFQPDGICEPAVAQMSEAMQVVLANDEMSREECDRWLLWGLDVTKDHFTDGDDFDAGELQDEWESGGCP